jgi:hypothetical protein
MDRQMDRQMDIQLIRLMKKTANKTNGLIKMADI